MENRENTAAEHSGTTLMTSRRKWGCAIAAALLLVIVIGSLATMVGAMIFGDLPEYELNGLKSADFALQKRIAQKLLPEIFNGEPETASILFTPQEVESLIRIIDNGVTLQNMLMGGAKTAGKLVKHYRVIYQNGRFDVIFPLDLERPWLFGGVIVLDSSLKPEKDGDELKLEINRFKLGKIDFPSDILPDLCEEIEEAIRTQADFDRFSKALKKFQIDENNNLRIVYSPKELRNVIFKR